MVMQRIGMFLSLSYFSYRGLFMWLTPWTFVSAVILAPFLNYLLFAFVAFNGAPAPVKQDVLLNFPVVSVAAVMLGGILQMFYYEQLYELWRFPQGTALRLLFAKAAFHIPNGFFAIAAPLLLSLHWLEVPFAQVDWPTLILSILAICFGYAGFSLLLGVLVSAIQEWLTPLALGGAVFSLLSGALIPLDLFPAWLHAIAKGLPVTHGLIAYRISILNLERAVAVREIATEVTISIAYSALACCAWILFSSARRRGRV